MFHHPATPLPYTTWRTRISGSTRHGCQLPDIREHPCSRDGPHRDYNVLGMDYLVSAGAVLRVDGKRQRVELTVSQPLPWMR